MKKYSKFIGWTLISIVILVLIYLLFFSKKVNAGVQTQPENSKNAFPLKAGSTGNRVVRLQTALNELFSSGQVPVSKMAVPDLLEIDGIFGPKTETVLQYFFGISEVSQEKYFNLTGDKS